MTKVTFLISGVDPIQGMEDTRPQAACVTKVTILISGVDSIQGLEATGESEDWRQSE